MSLKETTLSFWQSNTHSTILEGCKKLNVVSMLRPPYHKHECLNSFSDILSFPVDKPIKFYTVFLFGSEDSEYSCSLFLLSAKSKV